MHTLLDLLKQNNIQKIKELDSSNLVISEDALYYLIKKNNIEVLTILLNKNAGLPFYLRDILIRELVLRNPQDQQNLSESQTFVPVIRYLFENNTEGSDANGEQLNGKEFWLKGKAGAVGSYSSLAGYKRLKTEFIDILKNYSYPR